MKVYIDLQKLAISKVVDGTSPEYTGDINSNVFEILFFNYDNTNWFPTMSQLAPNGRQAGDFEADSLGVGETHDYTEDGVNYQRFTFTMGSAWVLMKGRSNLFIWYNVLDGAVVKKCVGKLNVMLNESNDNYFISNPTFNPAVKDYINGLASDIEDELNDKVDAQNATIASLSQASPSVFDTAANIQALQENKGVAVATDTGYIWYWDTTITPNAYVSSGLQYNGLYYKNLTDVDVTVRNDTFNDGYVATNDYTIIEATLSESLLTAITTSNYSFGCDMALLASDLGITLPTTEKTFYTKVSDSTGSFLFTDISSTSFNARVIKFSATDYEQTINLTFIHPTQNIGLVSFDPDHYFVLFEKTTAQAIVEINNDDIAQGGSFVEIWLKLTGVKLQGLLNITPKIYLTSDEEKTNLLNIPDTTDTYNSNNTLVECQNGTLSVFSLASMLGKATLSDIFVMVDRVDISNWASTNYTFETTITTPTSSSSFKLEGNGEIIYKYGENLASTYRAIVNVPNEVTTINATDTATRALSNSSQTQMIKGEAVQQISKRNIILRAGKDLNLLNIDYGESEVLFYPQLKLTNMSMFVELDEAYLFKARVAFFDYGRDVYIYLIKMLVDGSEFYRFSLGFTPDIVSIYFNDGKLLKNNSDMEQIIFSCSTEPMESNDTPITSGGVYTALEAKQDVLTFDNAPTQNSNNPVKSGGVYDAIKQAIADFKWELGTHTIDSETDSNVKYQKIAPVGTFGCEIDKLGGMSYKSENLIVLSDETTSAYTIKDGVITRLTNSVDRRTANLVIPITLIANQTYYFKDFNNTENDLTKRNLQFCSGSSVIINFGWRKVSEIYTPTENVVIDNIKFDFSETLETSTTIISPAIYKSNITEFKQGFSGIRNSAVTSVVSEGNLLNIPDVTETTTSGIKYSITNGVINISGTSTTTGTIFLPTSRAIASVGVGQYTYALYINTPNSNVKVFLGNNAGAFNAEPTFGSSSCSNNLVSQTKTLTTSGTLELLPYITNATVGATYNITIKPLLVKGSTAPTEFLPYQAPTTKAIPQAIQNLTGYGWGINDTCYNYIDYERKVFVQKVGRAILGNMIWELTGIANVFLSRNFVAKSVLGLCANYDMKDYSIDWTQLQNNEGFIRYTQSQLLLKNTSYNDADAFKTAMSGVYLYYELATPVETDISAYLTDDDKYIDVEPLGTITFTNTYEQDVPSEITYVTEVAK